MILIGLALLCSGNGALAGPVSVTIGTNDVGESLPFGFLRYQQIYDASSFSTPLLIDTITFFLADGSEDLLLFEIGYALNLSTTVSSSSSFSNSFDDNVGSDVSEFLGPGSESLTDRLSGGELTFAGNPFFYDPSLGNLLFDLRVFNIAVSASDGPTLLSSGTRQHKNGAFARRWPHGWHGLH
ncbi:MAG: hypothetical protein AAGI44_07525 [Pseudomonadota bacterium]